MTEGLRTPLAVLGVGLVCWLDVVTGAEISFSIFYLAPIAWIAWHEERSVALSVAFGAACAWYAADHLGATRYSHFLVPIWNASVRLGFFVLAVEALQRIRAALRDVEQLARIDSLTGVANSRSFRESASIELARSARYGNVLSILYLDIDRFKAVNETLGHEAGDEVLRQMGGLLRRNLRKADLPGRLGGDEFAVLLPETRPDAARAVAMKLRGELDKVAKAREWPVSLSVGIAAFREPPETVSELVRCADQVMYEVKHSGRDGIALRVF